MPRKILHIQNSVNQGGIETWQMQMFRGSRVIREESQICIMSAQPLEEQAYTAELREMGIPLYPLPLSRRKMLSWLSSLRALCKRLAPQIAHVQLNGLSGYPLLALADLPIPQKIAHYHVTYPSYKPLTYLFASAMRQLEAQSATQLLGCSSWALETYQAALPAPLCIPRRVLHYGIDLRPYEQPVDATALRASLGIPPDAFVIGHVGRFNHQKNHRFIIEIAKILCPQLPQAHFLWIGDGELRSPLEAAIRDAGLPTRFTLTGTRKDIPALMKGAMDLFLFPSLFEGLGLVMIEAQAGGRPCLYADTIPPEADVVPSLLQRLSLRLDANAWAEAILASRDRAYPPQEEALKLLYQSPYHLPTATRALEEIYGLSPAPSL
jgi:glycosyltransferase involved in cell wall biosynthesis